MILEKADFILFKETIGGYVIVAHDGPARLAGLLESTDRAADVARTLRDQFQCPVVQWLGNASTPRAIVWRHGDSRKNNDLPIYPMPKHRKKRRRRG